MESANNTNRDNFLKLVTGQIKGNPYNIINQAIVFYGFCSALEEKDFELLKRIITFLEEYDLITEGQESFSS